MLLLAFYPLFSAGSSSRVIRVGDSCRQVGLILYVLLLAVEFLSFSHVVLSLVLRFDADLTTLLCRERRFWVFWLSLSCPYLG